MGRSKDLITKRNAAIRKDYERLRQAKDGRKPKYTADYVVTLLAEKYFLSERRVEDLVYAKS
jgi:hypothetical protein